MQRSAVVRSASRAVAVVSFPALIAGCGPSVAEHPRVHADSVPELELTEDLRLGSVHDAQQGFSRIAGVVVAPDGRIAVLERQERHVRVYDDTGALIRTIGRSGQGPGEFRSPSWIGLRNDTIWVGDQVAGRLTVLTLDGVLVSTVPAPGVRLHVPGVSARLLPDEPIGNGRYSSRLHLAAEISAGWDSTRVPAVIFDSTGEVVDTAGTHYIFASSPPQIIVGGAGVLMPLPLYDAPLSLTTGSDTVTVLRSVAASPGSGTFEVIRAAGGGTPSYHLALAYTPRPLNTEHIVEETKQRNGLRGNNADAEAAIRANVPLLPFYPAVRRGMLGQDGSVWLQREDVGGDLLNWLVVSSEGSPVGRAQLPRGSTVMWVSAESIWVMERDESDVPWLVRLRVGE